MKRYIKAMNPLLPQNCFVPDAEARVMPDGRLYLYGSWDRSGAAQNDYCSHELHCFSTDDMEHWVDHGVIFRNDESFCGIPWNPSTALYAPDAIHKDGKYYLYVCGNHKEEGVAVADSPTGPFSPAQKIEIADGDSIDPSIFVDDDGQAYLFWGQFTLRGAKLAKDMKTILPETVTHGILTEWEHGFHEGASIRRRGDKYYMVYTDIARGKATCMSYAISDSPMGPYKKGGVIIDNTYCDPETWNNHGSIAEFKGQWYVFYHRSSQNRNTCRRVCAEPIFFDADGWIREVEPSSQGPSAPLHAFEPIRARHACRIMGKSFLTVVDGEEILLVNGKGHWHNADWVEYKYLDFSATPSVFCVTAKGMGKITVKTEKNRTLAICDVNAADWQKSCARINLPITGIHPIWLHAEGDLQIKEFRFADTDSTDA
jgi:hypothetical protein